MGLAVSGVILGSISLKYIRKTLEVLHEDNIQVAKDLEYADNM